MEEQKLIKRFVVILCSLFALVVAALITTAFKLNSFQAAVVWGISFIWFLEHELPHA